MRSLRGEDKVEGGQAYADMQSLMLSRAFPEQFLGFVEEEWHGHYAAYADGMELAEFTLEEHDRLVCLEAGDGLPKDGGWVEYVERVRLGELELYLLEYGHYIWQLPDRQSRQLRGVMVQQKHLFKDLSCERLSY